jgi:hypothetical protein
MTDRDMNGSAQDTETLRDVCTPDALARAQLQRRFPRLRPRITLAAERILDLFRRSGYIQLREPECNIDDWQRFAADYSFDMVYCARDGAALGHFSLTRVYRHTWLAHQLATLSGHAESGPCRATLYELISAVPLAHEGERAYGLAYYNPGKSWHRLFFGDFAAQVADERLVTVAHWDFFERGALGALPLTPRVGLLAAHERDAASALIRSRLPRLLADAMDIVPESLSSVALNGDVAHGRIALVLREGRELLAVALCERGPMHGSLFNILNGAHFFFAASVAGDEPDAHAASVQLELLSAVLRYYAAQGIERPLLLAPPGTFAAERQPGISLRERMAAIAFSSEGLARFEAYCRLHMTRLFYRHPPRSTASAAQRTGESA